MYNKTMKKISVLLLLALLSGHFAQLPCQAGFLAEQKNKIEQKKIFKSTQQDIETIIKTQNKFANEHNIKGLMSLYCDDFVTSDGFGKDIYEKLIEETWETYSDITYKTEIKNINFSDNYATVLVFETSVATQKEEFEGNEIFGELNAVSKCVYYLEKHGSKWFLSSEKIIEEITTLKYGDTRFFNIQLNAPKQIGSNKYYTATLKTDIPNGYITIGSIGKENIVYPQTKMDEAFRRLSDDNILERVFLSNNNSINEYIVASVAVTHPPEYTKDGQIKIYMGGLAFIMTRVNVIPENKFVKFEQKEDKDGKI